MSTAYNSKQFNNGMARQFYINYDDTHNDGDMGITAPVAPLYQSDRLFMSFFQNAQAVSSLSTWNAWAVSPSGTIPSYNDTYYPEYFNSDTSTWRNKHLFTVPCTRREMVEKDSSGSIEYNGQKWEVVSSYNEEETFTGDEPRYVYVECDLKYYDAALAVSVGVTSKNLITGLGLYKTKLKVDATAEDVDFTTDTDWSAAIEYDATSKYEYYTHDTINSAATSTQYDPQVLKDANLTYLYQNTFPGVTRSDIILTKFSLIIEF